MTKRIRAIHRHLRPILRATAVGAAAILGPGAFGQGNVDLPRFPSLSPDGREIVFSWRGDLWKVSSDGGTALRLTSHPGNDLRSGWSRDGRRIAFDSDRDGYRNLHLMDADGTGVRQVTNIDRACDLVAFGTDAAGKEVLTFSSVLEGDVYRSHRPYLVSLEGGELVRVHDAFGSHPVVSPDGKRVLFTRGGYYYGWPRRLNRSPDAMDVWLYDREADSFTQLTTWKGQDGNARWLNDSSVIYLSDRDLDNANLFRMTLSEGEDGVEQLTSFDRDPVQHFDVSADGRTAVFVVWDGLYTLDLTRPGAEPRRLAVTANEDWRDNYEVKSVDREVSEAVLSPDGKVMAYVAYGEVYVRNIEKKSPTRRVTDSHARDHHIAWSPDGLKLYFVSDRDGTDSIYVAAVALTRGEIKEAFDQTLNPEPEEEEEADEEAGHEEEPAEADDSDEAEADDAAHDDDDDGHEDDEDVQDEEDEEEEELPKELDPERWHDAVRFTIEPLVVTAENDRAPTPSPDGKKLLFKRSRGDLVVLDLESGEEMTLIEGWDLWMGWRWSPDSRHVAYAQSDMNFNSDIFIVPADGSAEPVNVTMHPDNDEQPRWSADGKILAFTSERLNEEYDVWMVYLDKDLESYTPKELQKYYDDAVEAAKKRKPLSTRPDEEEDDDEENGEEDADADGAADEDEAHEDEEAEEEPEPLDLDDAYLRLRRVTSLPGSEGNLELTPGGDRYIFTGSYGESGLWSVRWDGEERKKLTGPANVQHVSLTGDKVVYVSGGRAATVPPGGGEVEQLDIDDSIRLDLQQQSSQKFLEAARVLGEQFYHPTMKGLDWAALTERYHVLARQTRTGDEFNHVGAYFLGELAASHLGIRASDPSSPNRQAHGRLGIDAERAADGFRVTKVIPQGPAAIGPMALEAGDVITAVGGVAIGPLDTIEAMLQGRIGEEVIVDIRRALEDGRTVDLQVLLSPTSFGAERQLRYEHWRDENARLVSEWSDGRLGYIHIQGMSQPSLDVFERDLFAACEGKDGLIVDVRNNGGGWTTDRLLSSIMVVPHAYTVPRGAPHEPGHYPQDRLFIQRYTLPMNALCNEKSFSNAEIFSHAFKTLERGTLVGQETWGGVISTGGFVLIDGTFVRLPFRGWYLTDGADMENHGAVPHLLVPQTPEAEVRGDDEQLRAAVDDLLGRLD